MNTLVLKNKIALVTGASQGIGKSIAMRYAKEGAVVLLVARNEEKLKSIVNEIKRGSGLAYYFVCDLTNLNQISSLTTQIEKDFGKIHVLVNNASILGYRKPIMDYPIEVWKNVMECNVNGVFYITKALLPLMIKEKGGTIINLSSSVGREGRKNWGAYSVSKFAIEGLTQVLAQELSDYLIRVHSVNPGATRTTMRAEAYPEEDPLTLPHPDEIVDIFVHLAKEDSPFITGSALSVKNFKDFL